MEVICVALPHRVLHRLKWLDLVTKIGFATNKLGYVDLLWGSSKNIGGVQKTNKCLDCVLKEYWMFHSTSWYHKLREYKELKLFPPYI